MKKASFSAVLGLKYAGYPNKLVYTIIGITKPRFYAMLNSTKIKYAVPECNYTHHQIIRKEVADAILQVKPLHTGETGFTHQDALYARLLYECLVPRHQIRGLYYGAATKASRATHNLSLSPQLRDFDSKLLNIDKSHYLMFLDGLQHGVYAESNLELQKHYDKVHDSKEFDFNKPLKSGGYLNKLDNEEEFEI